MPDERAEPDGNEGEAEHEPRQDGEADVGEADVEESVVVFAPLRFVLPVEPGGYFVALPDAFRKVVIDQIQKVRERIMSDSQHPSLRRIFPVAYVDNRAFEDEYQRLMRSEMIESRLAAFDVVEQTLQKDVINEAQLLLWMQSVNVARLALAAAEGFDEEENIKIPSDDSRAQSFEIFEFLQALLHDIVEALRAGGALDPKGPSR